MRKISKLLMVLIFATVLAGFFFTQEAQAAYNEPFDVVSGGYYHATDENGLVYSWRTSSSDDCLITIIGYEGDNPDVVIPEYFHKHPVNEIGEEAFKDNKLIKSVTVPQTIGYINNRAFMNCENLEEIKFVGDFYTWMKDLSYFSYDHGLYLYDHIVDGCSSLKSINLEYDWEPWGHSYEVFYGSGLETASVVMGSGDRGAFTGCKNLETVNLYYGSRQYNGSLNLNEWKALPSLKEINVYNAKNCKFHGDFYFRKDGKFSNPDRIPYLPTLEYVNYYLGGEAVNTQYSLPQYGGWVSSDESIAKLTDDGFGTISIYKEGLVTFTSEYADYDIRVYVGDEADWETYRKAAENKKNGNSASKKEDEKSNYSEDIEDEEPNEPDEEKRAEDEAFDKAVEGRNGINLEKCDIELPVDSFVFYGENIRPAVYVTYKKNILKKGTDFVLKYENNDAVGTATVYLKGVGKYCGTLEENFEIMPCGAVVEDISKSSSKYTVAWNENPYADGYELAYSKKKSSGYKKIAAGNKLQITNSKLKKGMYIKVRAYTLVDGDKYYSSYSTPIKLK